MPAPRQLGQWEHAYLRWLLFTSFSQHCMWNMCRHRRRQTRPPDLKTSLFSAPSQINGTKSSSGTGTAAAATVLCSTVDAATCAWRLALSKLASTDGFPPACIGDCTTLPSLTVTPLNVEEVETASNTLLIELGPDDALGAIFGNGRVLRMCPLETG